LNGYHQLVSQLKSNVTHRMVPSPKAQPQQTLENWNMAHFTQRVKPTRGGD
jgi:hypothetical protein